MNKTLLKAVGAIAAIAVLLYLGSLLGKSVINNYGAVSSPYFPGPEMGLNELNTYVVRADFTDKSTTFVSFQNPFPATSTIDLVELNNTGVATSTYVVHCGAKDTSSGAPTIDIVTSGDVATSTNFKLMTNNVTTALGAIVSGGSIAKIVLGTNQYFLCYATTYADTAVHDGAFTGTNNTFDGNYKVRFVR